MTKQDDVVQIELPAPSGWKKKYTPNKGGTPRRNAIVFIAPTGEEIKSKRQLDQYLKAHPGGPSASEFDWGTGDTPRRSARLSEKSKVTESPESETPKKKQRKSSSKKGAKDKSEGEGDAAEGKEATTEESEGSPEVEMADGEHAGGRDDGEITTKEVQPDESNVDDAQKKPDEIITKEVQPDESNVDDAQKKPDEITTKEVQPDETNVDDAQKKPEGGETVSDMPPGNEDNLDVKQKTGENNDELNVEEKTGETNDEQNVKKDDTQEAENKPSDVKEENADSKSLPSTEKESNEVGSDLLKPESASELPLQNAAAASGPEAAIVKNASSEADDGKVGDSGDAKAGQVEHPLKETTENSAEAAKVDDNLKNSQEANNPSEDHTVPTGDQGASS